MKEHRVQPDRSGQLLLDREAGLFQHRLIEIARQLHAAIRQHQRAAAEQWIRIAGLHDRLNLLVRAVQLHGLSVGRQVEPVEEHARAAAHRRLAALERRPHDAAARTESRPAQPRLVFLAHAAAERQRLCRAVVVLHVDAGLHLRRADQWIADVSSVGGRPSARERVEIRERERADAVAPLGGAIAIGLEEHAGPQRVLADREVEIVGDLDAGLAASAVHLRAARVERVEDQDRRRLRRRS